MASFIDVGLPRGRNEWPEGVLDAVSHLVQGDVVPCPPIVYYGDPRRPVHEVTRRYATEYAGPMLMTVTGSVAPRWAVLTSGTCDIGEEDSKQPLRPTVQLSPVVNLSDWDSGKLKQVQSGRIHYLVHLPALSIAEEGFWVADLRIEFPVEKGWIAGQTPISGFDNEVDREKIGKAIARIRERPALASKYYDFVHGPLGDELAQIYKGDRALAENIERQTIEWGIQVDSRLHPERIEVVLLGEGVGLSAEVQEWWRVAVDLLRPNASANSLLIVGPRFDSIDRIPVAEYRRLTILPSPSRYFSQA
jgi:hypothetical protein